MKIVIKQPKKEIEVKDITLNLENLKKIIGGNIEYVMLNKELDKRGIFAYGDDEAKCKYQTPNFWIYDKQDFFCGTAIFCKDNGQGEETDLTDDDIKLIKQFLKVNKMSENEVEENQAFLRRIF